MLTAFQLVQHQVLDSHFFPLWFPVDGTEGRICICPADETLPFINHDSWFNSGFTLLSWILLSFVQSKLKGSEYISSAIHACFNLVAHLLRPLGNEQLMYYFLAWAWFLLANILDVIILVDILIGPVTNCRLGYSMTYHSIGDGHNQLALVKYSSLVHDASPSYVKTSAWQIPIGHGKRGPLQSCFIHITDLPDYTVARFEDSFIPQLKSRLEANIPGRVRLPTKITVVDKPGLFPLLSSITLCDLNTLAIMMWWLTGA